VTMSLIIFSYMQRDGITRTMDVTLATICLMLSVTSSVTSSPLSSESVHKRELKDTECGSTLNATQGEYGEFITPGMLDWEGPGYANDLTCDYLIKIPQGHILRFAFEVFDVEKSDNCVKDKMEIYRGATDKAPLEGRWCGADIPNVPEISGVDTVLVRLSTDGQGRKQGILGLFELHVPPQVCSKQYHGSSGEFSSPGYDEGKEYYNSLKCDYTIEVPQGQTVQITFETFDVEPMSTYGRGCYDQVEIIDGTSVLGPFCGTTVPTVPVSSSNQVVVRLTTDGSEGRKGFKATYTAV